MKCLIALMLVLSACTSATLPTPTPRPSVSVSAGRVARSITQSTECARSLLNSFISAFNRGDSEALETFFSKTEGAMTFQWFVTPETPAGGPGISQLPEYLARWRSAGERWRLATIQANASPGWHRGIDFAMEIERAWPDRSVVSPGKGALDCDTRTIFVFALGDAVK